MLSLVNICYNFKLGGFPPPRNGGQGVLDDHSTTCGGGILDVFFLCNI